LRDFSDPASPLGVIAQKPDLAAPGVDIDSADGVHTEELLPRSPAWHSGLRFALKSGTSMATPMIAGVVALMLDKKNDLNVTEVRALLTGSVRAAVNPAAPPASTQAYGSGMVDALASHLATP
jgi:subtilisin family serine protease